MVTRKRTRYWEYDFFLLGKRHRKGRFKTKAEAAAAEKLKREELLSGETKMTFREAFDAYMASANTMAATTRDDYAKFMERTLAPCIGHLVLSQVTTHEIDKLKQTMPKKWGPKSINQRLILVSAVLRFAWKREWLSHLPYIPMEKLPRRHVEWYSVDERDQFLQGVFDHQPQWYLFFYLAMRLGLRVGEAYAIEHVQFRADRLQLLVDRSVQRGSKVRQSTVKLRKANDTMILEVTQDVIDAYDWHCRQGFAGKRLVFCPTDEIPKFLDSHKAAIEAVVAATGLRRLTHHKLGRHSVGSQADDAGATSKAIQKQLGHQSAQSTQKYVHGSSKAQRAIVESLRPVRAPHEVQRDELN